MFETQSKTEKLEELKKQIQLMMEKEKEFDGRIRVIDSELSELAKKRSNSFDSAEIKAFTSEGELKLRERGKIQAEKNNATKKREEFESEKSDLIDSLYSTARKKYSREVGEVAKLKEVAEKAESEKKKTGEKFSNDWNAYETFRVEGADLKNGGPYAQPDYEKRQKELLENMNRSREDSNSAVSAFEKARFAYDKKQLELNELLRMEVFGQ